MATCKYNVKQDRYMRKCGDPANKAIVFTTELDDSFLITTQLPVCDQHLIAKKEDCEYFGLEYKCLTLTS